MRANVWRCTSEWLMCAQWNCQIRNNEYKIIALMFYGQPTDLRKPYQWVWMAVFERLVQFVEQDWHY